MMIMRGSTMVVLPTDYASWPEHQSVVKRLEREQSFVEAVKILEDHAVSWLAADILRGEPWAQRYLLTMAKMQRQPATVALSRRGYRALCSVLTGTPIRRGRRRREALTSHILMEGALAVTKWRTLVKDAWGLAPSQFVQRMRRHLALSDTRHAQLLAKRRRAHSRWRDIALTLAAWEMGVPARRLRADVRQLADLVYG